MSGGNHFGSFHGNQNVHLNYLNQNGHHFRLYYVRGPVATVGVMCCVCVAQAWGRRVWGQPPRSHMPGLL